MRTEGALRTGYTGQEGFTLALVVLLLFAIAAMGATGYAVISSEAFQAQKSSENDLALAVAQGGLVWFTGTQRGIIQDTSAISINGGTATITTRKVATLSDEQDLYFVRSEGNYTDPRFPAIPATRVVSQYAIYHKVPMNVMAPVMTTAGRTRVERRGRIDATDRAIAGSCTSATGATLAGAVSRTGVVTAGGGTITGSPVGITLSNFQNVVDSVDTAWDVFSDPDFPVDYDDIWPNFSSLPSDSFPVVRVNGNFSPNWSRWGRGVLIVTGSLNLNRWSFWTWYGIVLAGDLNDFHEYSFGNIFGAVVAGQGIRMGNWDMEGSSVLYHSCYVEQAGLALAHLTPVENSWWEDTG